MTTITIPKIKKEIPISIALLAVVALLGLISMGSRWIFGLGVVTNLSDTRPWGLWISFDLAVMAFSGSAFSLAALTHMFRRYKYQNISRVALVSGFVGYICAAAALTVELGRPERLWHYFFYWNTHSPLFEVGMCVITYLFILSLEFLPMLFDKLGWHNAHKFLHYFEIPIVAAGIILSSGHQSSLGAISLALPLKLHPLWYSPLLPLIFFISAITSGFAMAILVGSLGLRFFDDWNFKEGVFTGLGKYLLIFLSFTFLLKLAELVYAGELNLIFENSYQSIMFIIENVLYILPIIILLVPKFKRRRKWIFRAGYLAVGGLVMHRFNVSFVGLAGAKYYPTWQELLSTAGLTAIGIIIFWLIASNLPLMEEEKA
jgi:Ni/Fe-hydrogenase subunit HybB-like protein